MGRRNPRFIDEFENLLAGNEIPCWRTRKASGSCPANSPSCRITGAALLRAAGVNYICTR